jgi:hypothetical protein
MDEDSSSKWNETSLVNIGLEGLSIKQVCTGLIEFVQLGAILCGHEQELSILIIKIQLSGCLVLVLNQIQLLVKLYQNNMRRNKLYITFLSSHILIS